MQDSLEAASLGYSCDNEEAEVGVGCICTLVRDAYSQVVAGLSVSAPIERRQDKWIAEAMETSAEISTLLGYHPV